MRFATFEDTLPHAVVDALRQVEPLRGPLPPGPEARRLRRRAGVARETVAVLTRCGLETLGLWERGMRQTSQTLDESVTFRLLIAAFIRLDGSERPAGMEGARGGGGADAHPSVLAPDVESTVDLAQLERATAPAPVTVIAECVTSGPEVERRQAVQLANPFAMRPGQARSYVASLDRLRRHPAPLFEVLPPHDECRRLLEEVAGKDAAWLANVLRVPVGIVMQALDEGTLALDGDYFSDPPEWRGAETRALFSLMEWWERTGGYDVAV